MQSPSPARPATVTVAFALQVALAGTLLVSAALAIAGAVHYDGLIDRAQLTTTPAPGEVAGERAANLAGALFVSVPAVLLAVWLGITAIRLRRGSNVARILIRVALVMLGSEAAISVVLALRFWLHYHYSFGRAVWEAVFHAVQAFNNAGFALYPDSLVRFVGDWWICVPLALGVLGGSIGFPVLFELARQQRLQIVAPQGHAADVLELVDLEPLVSGSAAAAP